MVVPVEFGFSLGPLFFTWSKAYLLIMSIGVLPLAILTMRLRAFDWFLIAHVTLDAPRLFGRLRAGRRGIGSRRDVRDRGDDRLPDDAVLRQKRRADLGVIRLLFWLVLIATIPAIPEAILKVRFIHDFAQSTTGNWYLFSNEERSGMLRAASFFEHPILFGVFCSALLSPVWFTTTGAARLVKLAVVATGTFFSLSSAPLLVFMAQLGLIGVEKATRWLPRRVAVLGGGAVGLFIFLQLFSGRGAIGWLTLLMLDPATAWYRKAQIEYSMDDILRNPFFGIGNHTWTRPYWVSESIDDHFIAIAIRSGLPALFFFLGALYLLWRTLGRIDATQQPPLFLQLRRGWGLMMVALILGGLTVTYFGRMQPLLAFYIGLGASLAGTAIDPVAGRGRASRPASSADPEDASSSVDPSSDKMTAVAKHASAGVRYRRAVDKTTPS